MTTITTLIFLVMLHLCASRELSFLKRSARQPAPQESDLVQLARPPQCQKDLYPPDQRHELL